MRKCLIFARSTFNRRLLSSEFLCEPLHAERQLCLFLVLFLLQRAWLVRQQVTELEIRPSQPIHFIRLDVFADEHTQLGAPLFFLGFVLADVLRQKADM